MESVVTSDSITGSDNNKSDNEKMENRKEESDQFGLDSGQVRNLLLSIT